MIVMQAFRHERFEEYIPRMERLIKERILKWNGPVRLMEQLRELTLDIMIETMVGIVPGSDEHARFLSHYWPITHRGKKSSIPCSHYQKAMKSKRAMWWILKKKHAERPDEPTALNIMFRASQASKQGPLTEDELISYAYMLTEFGESDVAALTTYALFEMLSSPQWLNSFEQELAQFSGSSVDLKMLNRLSFIQHSISEAERLHPPVPFIARQAMVDMTFKGFRIKKGSKFICSIEQTHLLEELFDNATVFDPNRFARSGDEHKAPFSLLGFGGGSHSCVAKQYSQLLSVLIVFLLGETFAMSDCYLVPGTAQEKGAKIDLSSIEVDFRLRVQ